MQDRVYGDWIPMNHTSDMPDVKELEKQYGSKLKNRMYSRAMNNYLHCVAVYFGKHTIPQLLEKQLIRSDLDTVCGYELVQMKQLFLNTDVLEYKRFLETDPKYRVL